jgi:hypothetical protein
MQLKTTDQAAQALGITQDNLKVYIWRHPELRPAHADPKVSMLFWTDEEIEAVRQARASKRRPISRKL